MDRVRVDPQALAGIGAKLERADEHMRTLHEEMDAWDAERPYRLAREVHDHGCKHLYRLKLLKPIPVAWAVILGEVVHDLRSALDQAVYWLTVDWTGRRLEGTAFPVKRSRAAFFHKTKKGDWASDSGMFKVRGVGPGPLAFVERLQPYPQRLRNDVCFAVRSLHDFSNQDKHRLVHLFGMRFDDYGMKLVDKPRKPLDCTPWIDRRVRRDDEIVFRLQCSTPHPRLELDGDLVAMISLTIGKRARGGSYSAWLMNQHIHDIATKLVGAIGNQNAAIRADVWTHIQPYPERRHIPASRAITPR